MFKKGVLQVQLNWIFVIFIGIIILIFFVMIVQRQRAGFSVKKDFVFREDLMDLFSGAEATSAGSFKVVKPKVRIRLSPDEISVGNLKNSLDLVVFGPSEIPAKERELIFSSLTLDLPFPASKFVFLTSPSVRYVFAWDENDPLRSDFEKFYNDALFEFIFKEQIDLNGGEINYNSRGVFTKFVILSSTPKQIKISGLKSSEYDAVIIIPDGRLSEKYPSGSVNFIYRGFDQGSSEYLGKASLIGSIYSEQRENYEILMKKSMNQVYAINKILLKKNEKLESRKICPIYETMKIHLQNYDRFIESIVQNTWGNVQSMKDEILNIEWVNEQIFIQSCPYLY